MNLLLISEVREGLAPPNFGGEFAAHIARKRNPAVLAASLTAWSLLAEGLRRMERPSFHEDACAAALGEMPSPGELALPAVRFGEAGKPAFCDLPLHFSLAHSGRLAVALLSDRPCGVDVERIRPEVDARLRERCLSQEELRRDLDFFECWVKKECIGKLGGRGIDAHPAKIDVLDARWSGRFFFETVVDSDGQNYALAALCEGAEEVARSVVWM